MSVAAHPDVAGPCMAFISGAIIAPGRSGSNTGAIVQAQNDPAEAIR